MALQRTQKAVPLSLTLYQEGWKWNLKNLDLGIETGFVLIVACFMKRMNSKKFYRSKKKINSGAVNVKNGSNALEIFLSMAILSTT